MYQEDFNLQILGLLSKHWTGRVLSLDLETHVRSREGFLTDEYILGIALATRVSGDLTAPNGIDSRVLVLEDENEESEARLLQELDEWLGRLRPLGLIGYGLRNYDVPLLSLKNQKHRPRFQNPLWKLADVLQQAAHVDLYFMLKTFYGVKNLREAVDAPAFQALPLRRQKHLVATDFKGKGEDIARMWKSDRESFIRYAEADAVDALLLAEEIVRTRV